MNFLNIEYFLAAAKELNFTKAAEKLYISPQSLSTHISKLENELGTELFYRDHPMRLTYAGEILVSRGQEILDKRNETLTELRDITDPEKGRLSIGISHTRGLVFLPLCLPRFHEKHPYVKLEITEGATAVLDKALSDGEIDLMISLVPFQNENIEAVELCREEILLLIPDVIAKSLFGENVDSAIAKMEKTGDISPLKTCPFLLMHTENRVRGIADGIFEANKIKPQILLEVENIETLLELCRKGMGITFYPHTLQTYSQARKFEGLFAVKLKDVSTQNSIGIGYMKNRFLSLAGREFIKEMQEAIKR